MKKEEAIRLLANATYSDEWQGNEDLQTAQNMAIEALEQEQFMNKPCVSAGVCEHDKLQLLDRIKADIEKQQYGFMNSTDYANGVRFGLMLAYKIIKKCKKEIEG